MTPPVAVLACLWVLAAVAVAMLPRRWQYAPGIALLFAAAALIWRLAADYGAPLAVLAVLAVGLMFRKPLRAIFRRALARISEGRT